MYSFDFKLKKFSNFLKIKLILLNVKNNFINDIYLAYYYFS